MIEGRCPLCGKSFAGWADFPVRTALHGVGSGEKASYITYATAVGLVNGRVLDRARICIGIVDTGAPDAMKGVDESRIVAKLDATGEGPEDVIGHATHVASGLASEPIESPAGPIRGMCPNAEIVFAKAISLRGGTFKTVIKAVEMAVEHGAEVLNLSLGSSVDTGGRDPLSQLLDHLAVEHEIHSAVAVGNDGPWFETVNTPATADWVQSVGAVASWGQVANFSSRGPNVRGEINPVLVAPGGAGLYGQRAEYIWGEVNRGSILDKLAGGKGFAPLRGTSMATPLVCGALAKAKAARRNLSIQNVRIALMLTCKRFPVPVQDNVRGFGILDTKSFVETIKKMPELDWIPLELI